jgi:glycosyltransferase involved in cell wall biosynthesis
MKVLLVNTFHYHRGGDCTYTFSLADLLRRGGHDVRFFGMHHPENLPHPDSRYWVDAIDFVDANRSKNPRNAFRVVSRAIYSTQARDRIARMLEDVRPDVAHLQNLHAHLTPSILEPLAERGIPAIWTLHDFKLICPNSHLLSNGTVCESCRGHRYHQCVLKKCKKGSRLASIVAALEATVHQFLGIRKKVSRFVSPSRFLRDKFLEFGWPEEKLGHVRNFLPEERLGGRPTFADEGYVLYFGQLEPWKGVGTLVRAMAGLGDRLLVVAGDGTERAALEAEAVRSGAKVRFTGRLSWDTLRPMIEKAAAVAIPSECYENCPYTVMETMAMGKPVLATNLGGLPELVEDGVTGVLVRPKDPSHLREALERVLSDAVVRRRMGEAARERAVAEFDPALHYDRILDLYRNAATA